MKIVPNIGKPTRIAFVAAGLALVATPFAIALEGWPSVVLPVFGGLAMATGAVGW